MKNKQIGFTIVELLVVIVIIGILAGITIVAYNGIQQRARVSTAQTDMRNLHQSMTLRLINGESNDGTTWVNALRDAKLYEATHGTYTKLFALCSNTTDNSISIVTWNPVQNLGVAGNGSVMPTFVKGSLTTSTYNSANPGTLTLTKSCYGADPDYTAAFWSNAG
ncbi:MAG TPA: prepilin-type N-terminal cleavage/methylation domain-containing protein [Candidatus Saccharimonadales bacterium]